MGRVVVMRGRKQIIAGDPLFFRQFSSPSFSQRWFFADGEPHACWRRSSLIYFTFLFLDEFLPLFHLEKLTMTNNLGWREYIECSTRTSCTTQHDLHIHHTY
jgi:hypothetical protein